MLKSEGSQASEQFGLHACRSEARLPSDSSMMASRRTFVLLPCSWARAAAPADAAPCVLAFSWFCSASWLQRECDCVSETGSDSDTQSNSGCNQDAEQPAEREGGKRCSSHKSFQLAAVSAALVAESILDAAQICGLRLGSE